MRKIMVLIMMLVAVSASAEWLTVDYNIQTGFNFNGVFNIYEPEPTPIVINQHFFTMIGLDFLIGNHLTIGGSVNFPWKDYVPAAMNAVVYTGFNIIDGLNIRYEHFMSMPFTVYLAPRYGNSMPDSGYGHLILEWKGKLSF